MLRLLKPASPCMPPLSAGPVGLAAMDACVFTASSPVNLTIHNLTIYFCFWPNSEHFRCEIQAYLISAIG
jgi:hypothetical protein